MAKGSLNYVLSGRNVFMAFFPIGIYSTFDKAKESVPAHYEWLEVKSNWATPAWVSRPEDFYIDALIIDDPIAEDRWA